jgi:predicted  nucleic acid-binding Zn-ribbon protein
MRVLGRHRGDRYTKFVLVRFPWCAYDRPPRRGAGRSETISTLTPSPVADQHITGESPGAGTFACLDCGSHLSLREQDTLPECPRCGATSFHRDSIFESMQEHDSTVEFDATADLEEPAWLDEARRDVPSGARRLAYEDEGEVQLVSIERGWTRIGRSVNADVRLDDPSVSRRHALIVSEPGAALRVLDDRSLNGVIVNGEQVDSGTLSDGDELTVGRYRLFVLEG